MNTDDQRRANIELNTALNKHTMDLEESAAQGIPRCVLTHNDPSAHCFHWTGRGDFNGARCAMEYERQCCRCGRMSLALITDASTPCVPGHGPYAVAVGGDANGAENVA